MWYKVKRIMVWTNQVRPSVPATAITLNKSSISLTTAGQTSQLPATLTPSWSTSTVSWSSSNTSIARVSSSWLVTCVTPWSCTITATTNNWLTATCSVSNTITETYTLTISSQNIQQKAKAWYRVKSVRMQGTVSFSGSSQAYIWTWNSSSWSNAKQYRIVIDKVNYDISYQYGQNWVARTKYYTRNPTINSSNTLDATITRDWSSITWNWTTYNYTYTNSQKTNVLNVLDSSTFSILASPYNSSSGTITFTVTYEPV